MSEQKPQYDGPPSTFLNVKRVKQEVDTKGRDKVQITLGTYTDSKTGVERNSLNELIDVLLTLQGKQANLDIRIEMKKSSSGAMFPSAFLRVAEMVPRGAGQVAFTPKPSRAQEVKSRAAEINKAFKS